MNPSFSNKLAKRLYAVKKFPLIGLVKDSRKTIFKGKEEKNEYMNDETFRFMYRTLALCYDMQWENAMSAK